MKTRKRPSRNASDLDSSVVLRFALREKIYGRGITFKLNLVEALLTGGLSYSRVPSLRQPPLTDTVSRDIRIFSLISDSLEATIFGLNISVLGQ